MPIRYQVIESHGGFEAQMLYIAPMLKKEIWQPLNEKGFWADPDAYSYGNPRWRVVFATRQDAERAITLAMAVNGENIREAESSKSTEA